MAKPVLAELSNEDLLRANNMFMAMATAISMTKVMTQRRKQRIDSRKMPQLALTAEDIQAALTPLQQREFLELQVEILQRMYSQQS